MRWRPLEHGFLRDRSAARGGARERLRRAAAIRRLLLSGLLIGAAASARPAPAALAAATLPPTAAPERPAALSPTPTDRVIGQLVLHLLEQGHYDHHRITEKESAEFLRSYVESYDFYHMVFTKADVDGFEGAYAATLGERVRSGDIEPAYAIYDRFMTRLKDRMALAHELIASTFSYTADETLSVDWRHAPWPAAPEETRDLWRRAVKYEFLHAKLDGQKPEEQRKTVGQHYDNMAESFKEFDDSDVLQNFLAALCRVYDPHSDYLAAPREENFNISMRLALVGIGASLRSEGGRTAIVSLIPGGPADVDKRLKPGDKIDAVAQGDEPFVDVVGMKLDRLVQLIRGPKGTVVRLRVTPVDAIDPTTRVVVSLVRDEIHLKDEEAKAKLLTLHPAAGPSRRFGVIRLPSFYADMSAGGTGKRIAEDVRTLLDALEKKGIQGIVLDLRDNGGGALNQAVDLTGEFVGDGPVVQVKDGGGRVTVLDARKEGEPYRGPLAVLTSRASASASEILAAALQDYGRAVILGNRSTFGKGTVQSVIALDPFMPPALRGAKAGSVHLTIQKFYRVSGGSTQNRGVVPDISIPALEDYMDIAESSMPNALPYDEIRPADIAPAQPLRPSLAALKAASAARLAASKEYRWLEEDVDIYRRRTEKKTVPLNEAKLLADKAADEKRSEERKKERLSAGAPKTDELDITLENLEGSVPAASTSAVSAAAVGPKSKGGSAASVAKSSGTAEASAYEKAPPAPDVMLGEAMSVLSDIVSASDNSVAGSAPAQAPDPKPESSPRALTP